MEYFLREGKLPAWRRFKSRFKSDLHLDLNRDLNRTQSNIHNRSPAVRFFRFFLLQENRKKPETRILRFFLRFFPFFPVFSRFLQFFKNIFLLSVFSGFFSRSSGDLCTSSSTALLAHLFGKIDFFLLFCSSRACAATEGSKTARRNQFCQTHVWAKLLKSDPNIQIDF